MKAGLRREIGLFLCVAVWNFVQNRVPRARYGWLNCCGSAIVLAVGRRSGLSWEALGLGAGSWERGVSVARPLVIATAAGAAVAAGTPVGRRLVRDERVERLGPAVFAKEALFRIPVGTALFEELLFRGLLWGRWSARSGEAAATAWSSASFGLWHVLPTIKTAAVYRSGALRRTPVRLVATVTAAVAATTIAGVGFALVRKRARSVVAPVIVHGALNVGGYVAAWAAAPHVSGRPTR